MHWVSHSLIWEWTSCCRVDGSVEGEWMMLVMRCWIGVWMMDEDDGQVDVFTVGRWVTILESSFFRPKELLRI